MAVVLSNVNSEAGLQKLNDYLLTRSYITGNADMAVFTALSSAPPSNYVNVTRCRTTISVLSLGPVTDEGEGVKVEPSTCSVDSTPGVADPKTEEEPWDDETDMQKLEEAVRSVKMEGLLWGASKLVPVGYGIKKIQIMMTIVDDLVSVDI